MSTEFAPNSEGYIAGVWYVVKQAEAGYAARVPGQSPWSFLNWVRRRLNLPTVPGVSYAQMRAEIEEFALTFGKPGVPSRAQRAAADAFDDEWEEDEPRPDPSEILDPEEMGHC